VKKSKFLKTLTIFGAAACAPLLLTGCMGSAENKTDFRVYNGYIQTTTDGTTWENLISLEDIKGEDGIDGIQYTIGADGYWYLNGVKTNKKAVGVDGEDGNGIKSITKDTTNSTSEKTIYIIELEDGSKSTFEVFNGTDGKDGTDADVWTIEADGYWYKNSVKTDKKAIGTDGSNGEDGKDADIWSIGADGYWYKNGNITEYKAIGVDASYATYTITYDYGKAAEFFETYKTSDEIKSTEWVTTLPKINDEYKDSFLGWFISGTEKQIENYDFIGGNVVLEARFDVGKGLSGLYQNGKYIKTWTDLKDEYPRVFKEDKITMDYTFVLSGELVVDEQIEHINSNAFKDSNLTRIILHEGIKNIEESAFKNCNSLTDLVIPDSVTSIGETAFYGCSSLSKIVIPNSVTSIGQRAFEDCCYLGIIEIENGITCIGEGVFWGCYARNIIMPNSVTSIGSNAFKECSNLTSILIPNSVISIGAYAFDGCSSLASITIPASVTTISGGALFYGCSSLESIIVDEKNSVYDSRDNCNAIIETSTNKLLNGIKNTTIPNTIKSIGDSAFRGCKTLTSIAIPNGIESIGMMAFDGCCLDSVTIPESVTAIESFAFDSTIKTIIIESSTVANGLTTQNSFGNLIEQGNLADFLKTVYIKEGLSVNDSVYLLNYFAKQTTTDKEGYDKYVFIHP